MLFDIVDLSPVVLPVLDQNAPVGGGASSRGSHRLADISNCQRKWWFRYVQRVLPRAEPEFRLMGTLIHSAVAFHYAGQMLPELQPDWYKAKPLYRELLDQARGNAELADRAFEIGEQYIEYCKQRNCDWVPFSVENEYSAAIGVLDPDGEDEPAFTLDVLDRAGKPAQMVFPALNAERITCRTDLIVQRSTNGTMWAVDHKSKNPEFHAERFGKINPAGEFALDWQVLVNLMILRANDLPVRGFIIQRIKRDEPFDCHRQVLNIPGLAYEQAPRLARNQVRLERQMYRDLAAAKAPIPNFFNCFGRWGACFPPGTMVTTDCGPETIESLRPGNKVLTHLSRYRTVLNTHARLYEGDLITLEIARRRSLPLVSTPEHPIQIWREGHPEWVQAGDVKVGDHVATPLFVPTLVDNVVTTADEAELLGLYLAEGNTAGYVGTKLDSYSGKKVIWSFGHHEAETLVPRTVELIRRVYGLAATVKRRQTATCVVMYNAVIATQYGQEFGVRAPNKRIPARIMHASKPIILAFLRGWRLGDGGELRDRIYGVGSSKRVMLQWLALLAKHDIHPTIFKNDAAGGVIDGRGICRKFRLHMLQFAGKSMELIAPTFGREYTSTRGMVPCVEDAAVLLPVAKIKRAPYCGPVYNMEVEEDHTYIADGYRVHNCDYRPICCADDANEQRNILNVSYTRL